LLQLFKRIIFSSRYPLFERKFYDSHSVFKPENLLRDARRQLGKSEGAVPEFVVLDPDGDILDYLIKEGKADLNQSWACYHTRLYDFSLNDRRIGIIGNAVGGSFAVLLAEQLFVSGCKLLINITSSGKISENLDVPCYILVDKALRDEGTSFHYLSPSRYASIRDDLLSSLSSVSMDDQIRLTVGSVWTTDAPYRETIESIDAAKKLGLLAVEMETASLYAFSTASGNPIISFAHVTNEMALLEDDFNKGEAGGAVSSLSLISQCLRKIGPKFI